MKGALPWSAGARTGQRDATRDPRFDLFLIGFGLGNLHHLVQQIFEFGRVGPFVEYLDRWRGVKPTIGWPSEVGVAIYIAALLGSALLTVASDKRRAVALFGPILLLNVLASPEQTDSHVPLMLTSTFLVAVLLLAERIERVIGSGPAGAKSWLDWTELGLRWLCAQTYWFAFFYKLNPNWLSPRTSRASEVLVDPIAPYLPLIAVGYYGLHLLTWALAAHVFCTWQPGWVVVAPGRPPG